MGHAIHRNRWGRSPAKGSLTRRALKMLMRPEGATIFELVEAGLSPRSAARVLTVFRDEKGWDVRSFPCRDESRLWPDVHRTKPSNVHKIVGRLRWDGSYRSLVDPNKWRDEYVGR
jgi:hypothetical protein